MNDIEKAITKARIDMIALQPFFGTLAMQLRMRPMNDLHRAAAVAIHQQEPTLAVDGKNIWYAPEFIAKLSFEKTKTVIAHEVMHCVMDHIGRRGARDPMRWNVACDYAINQILQDAGFSFDGPGGGLLDPAYKGMSADQIYNLLPHSEGGDGKGNPQPLCNILDGEVKKDPALVDQWQVATAQAAMAANQAGKLPDSLKRLVDELLNPKTDWRAQLRRFITEKAKDDYSWTRPNKKMLANGVFLPSLYSERMGEIVVGVDTSGSISQEMLNVFANEIQAIRESVSPERVTVIYCDAQVNEVQQFEREDLLELKMVGGGGTAFEPVADYIEENDLHPVCVVYLTDGYGNLGFPQPAVPWMWAMTTDVEPVWGERVQVDMEA